jgi:glycosyltransferase involved in cell wall biosynthesis
VCPATKASIIDAGSPTGESVNVLLFNLRTDVADTTLGFTTSWINRLARRCEQVVVVTLYAGRVEVESNVRVHALSGSSPTSRAHKIAEFYRLALRTLRTSRIDVCFAHMTPVLATLFWPVATIHRIPILLWYAHGTVPIELRIAHRLVDRCVTSTPAGFQLTSDKLYVLGQGIDTEVFVPAPQPGPEYKRTALSVGRISARKRLDEVIRSIALLRDAGEEMRLLFVGGPITDVDRRYERQIRAQARLLRVADLVEFQGAVPFDRVPDVYQRGMILVNVSETGSLDKVILESMASGCIPVSRNSSFVQIARTEGLDVLVPSSGPEGVANCLREVLALPAAEQDALRQRLREIVVKDHSLNGLMDAIARHLEEIAFHESIREDVRGTTAT